MRNHSSFWQKITFWDGTLLIYTYIGYYPTSEDPPLKHTFFIQNVPKHILFIPNVIVIPPNRPYNINQSDTRFICTPEIMHPSAICSSENQPWFPEFWALIWQLWFFHIFHSTYLTSTFICQVEKNDSMCSWAILLSCFSHFSNHAIY